MKVSVQSEPVYLIELTLKEAQIIKTYCDLLTPMTPEITETVTKLYDALDKQGVPSNASKTN